MNFKAKSLMLAKAFSVWWGIFIILGCCVGFTLKILSDIFFAAGTMEKFDIKIFAVLMIAGSFVLAVISYAMSCIVHGRPERKLRKQLNAILAEKGICKEYIDLLCINCRGTMKNKVYIELAFAYSALGENQLAKENLEHIDLVSVLDIAQSTGDFCTAAYYYGAAMVIFSELGDEDNFREAYENGSFYINQLPRDSFIMTVKALHMLKNNLQSDALMLIEKSGAKRLGNMKSMLNYSFILSIRAYIYYSLEKTEMAEKEASLAMSVKTCPAMEKRLINMIREMRGNAVEEQSTEEVLCGVVADKSE